jgi:hypothetical protein
MANLASGIDIGLVTLMICSKWVPLRALSGEAGVEPDTKII